MRVRIVRGISIYYIRWFLGLLRGLFIISLRGMGSLWCGVIDVYKRQVYDLCRLRIDSDAAVVRFKFGSQGAYDCLLYTSMTEETWY